MRQFAWIWEKNTLDISNRTGSSVEVASEDSSVLLCLCPDLYTQRLDVIRSIRPPGEVRQVELNLIPPVVQPHGHGADERLHPCCALVVTRPKTTPDIFIIQHLRVVKKENKNEWIHESQHHVEQNSGYKLFLGLRNTRVISSPGPQKWNTFWGSLWSWPEKEAWCPVSSLGLRDTWCRWCCRGQRGERVRQGKNKPVNTSRAELRAEFNTHKLTWRLSLQLPTPGSEYHCQWFVWCVHSSPENTEICDILWF